MFLKIKLDGGSIMAMMGSTSEKMYLCQVPNFGFEIIKLRPGGWLAREGSLSVVSLSESIKDRADVGLLTEDALTDVGFALGWREPDLVLRTLRAPRGGWIGDPVKYLKLNPQNLIRS
jgi:hypothetical protein